ncbi:MAG TPA: hypothetical protein VK186_07570 [Candidatus Deferrimicrobium sp.]|nr:hypothetical protein [Candidatus Kapabacteria bacterium]HLP58669.1 hypothetical protein [Candidatus Deferrimicrobium sp.]
MLDTLQQNPVLKRHCAKGLQAIESKHRKCVQFKDIQVSCSLNIDEAFRKTEPQNNRWDYYMHVIDDRKLAYAVFFEPHTCTTKEVSCFIEKYRWLINKINSPFSFLVKDTQCQFYFWIPSSGNKIVTHSPQYKRLKKTNIRILKVIHDHDLNS